jgi:hypothetical protein
MQLPEDFSEFLKLLIDAGAEYLLVGGYAVGHHGYPRATGDIDVWIDSSAKNAEKVLRAVENFGFTDTGATIETFMRPDRVIRMGVPPLRIELLTGIDGLVFSDAYARRDFIDVDGLLIPVISRADLLANKRASGHPQDLADLEGLGADRPSGKERWGSRQLNRQFAGPLAERPSESQVLSAFTPCRSTNSSARTIAASIASSREA